MHAEIIVNGSTIMVTDETKDWTRQTANLFVYVPNAASPSVIMII